MKFLPPTICFIAAAALAYNDTTGWGWFILAGVICLL
jgi:hypothetical protein